MKEVGVVIVSSGISGVEELGPESVRERDGEGLRLAALDEAGDEVTGLL